MDIYIYSGVTRREYSRMALESAHVCFLFLIAVITATSATERDKRELPLSYSCDPRTAGSCYKGDLVSTTVADCKKDSIFVTCDPINDYSFSSVVDVPDVSKHGVNCVPVNSGVRFKCGSEHDTRCVCYKAVDYKKPKETLFNQCRCQYWPAVDTRMNQPSYCTQYDHGGTSGIHFYTCCDNCNDGDDTSCDGHTYQGGGSTGSYCSSCGQHSQSGGGRVTYRFNCVSCSQQKRCEDECNKDWVAKDVPTQCPRWSGCFRGCCVKASGKHQSKRQTTNGSTEVGEFCGDSICQAGEDHYTCPIDCCPSVNANDCHPKNCSNPSCCYDPHCCIFEAETAMTPTATPISASSQLQSGSQLMLILYLFGVFFVFSSFFN